MRSDRNGPSTNTHPYGPEIDAVERLVSGAALILGQRQDGVQEARTEADHAKAGQVRMAGDVATLFNELKALVDRHAELHTDRARLEADLEQAQRPWWQRLMGT